MRSHCHSRAVSNHIQVHTHHTLLATLYRSHCSAMADLEYVGSRVPAHIRCCLAARSGQGFMLAVRMGGQGSMDTGEAVFLACFYHIRPALPLFHLS